MRLTLNSYHFSKKVAAIVAVLFILTACDSSSDIPIQYVDKESQLSDATLQQPTEQQHQNKHYNKEDHQHTEFYFGFDLRSSPQEDAAQYLPFLNYLEQATGYHFKLRFTPKNSSTADELGQGKMQFASMGATSYLDAKSRYDVTSLVRGINHQGKAEYRSVFVVRSSSTINDIKSIKGRKLAFGSRSSTQGHLIPRIMLSKYGISLSDLRAYDYTGSHQNCAESVVSGKFDVCGMQDQLGEKLAKQGLLKVIHRSSYYPSSGIVVNNNVPEEVIVKVKKALLGFYPQGKHRIGLYHWGQTEMPRGFVASNEVDYAALRQWSVRLGFLEKVNKQE